LVAAIEPDESQGEPPLMPLLNRYKPIGTTADVDFKTTQPCFSTQHSHINMVAADTARWEQSAAFRLEQAALRGIVEFYARNEQLGFTIPYEFYGVSYAYEPDYLVRLRNKNTLVLEIKGMETEQDRAKHEAARRWGSAVNNWGELGVWDFHVNRDPQVLGRELEFFTRPTSPATSSPPQ
jgi:type III restriction enzyme